MPTTPCGRAALLASQHGAALELLHVVSRASLLVVGAHGLNPLRDAILGTTAERLVGRCMAPILVVRASPRAGYGGVLVALDLLPGSAGLVEAALRIAPGALGAAAGATGIVPVVERAHAARHVVESQRSVGADLVVIGKRRRGAVESFLLGSVTRHVLADAEADVLVLPA